MAFQARSRGRSISGRRTPSRRPICRCRGKRDDAHPLPHAPRAARILDRGACAGQRQGALSVLHREDFVRPWSDGEFEQLLAQDTVFGFAGLEIGRGSAGPVGFVLARLAAGEAEILTLRRRPQPSPRRARLAADACGAARASRRARGSAVPGGRRDQRRRRSRSTGGWASARSASARATTRRRTRSGPARLSCAAIFASQA